MTTRSPLLTALLLGLAITAAPGCGDCDDNLNDLDDDNNDNDDLNDLDDDNNDNDDLNDLDDDIEEVIHRFLPIATSYGYGTIGWKTEDGISFYYMGVTGTPDETCEAVFQDEFPEALQISASGAQVWEWMVDNGPAPCSCFSPIMNEEGQVEQFVCNDYRDDDYEDLILEDETVVHWEPQGFWYDGEELIDADETNELSLPATDGWSGGDFAIVDCQIIIKDDGE